jgi:BolA protein
MIQSSELNLQRINKMQTLITTALQPSEMSIVDESHLHAGHAGATTGKGHFNLTIKAEQLNELRALKAHQMVYTALGEMMQTDIHALSISIKK